MLPIMLALTIAAVMVNHMHDADEQGRTVHVPLPQRPGPDGYDVVIEPGILDEIGARVADTCAAHRYAVISDSRVAELYGERVIQSLDAERATLFAIPAGEWNKTREIWADLTDRMLRAGLGRDSLVVALGGGVVGDLAGFVAASYMRGVPIVQVPTTLLAMVDSSVGGKTGVDTRAGKNLVGAFHHPSLVLIDPAVLSTLPRHQLAAGLPEALKHGLILDAEYFERTARDLESIFARDPQVLGELVRRSVEIKASVVGRDASEAGYRKILNFGHTVGHALESLSGYELLHGEAVAIGLVAEAALGESLGLTESGTADRIRQVLERAQLPVRPDPDLESDEFFDLLGFDKKNRQGRSRYTLIAGVGRVAGSAENGWTRAVPNDVVRSVIFGTDGR